VTTDRAIYQLGQSMTFTFTETNQGTTPIQVLDGPASFVVYQDMNLVWTSEDPNLNYSDQYEWETLPPGQSLTKTALWNGVPNNLPTTEPTGVFIVSNRLDPTGGSAAFKIASLPLTHLSTSLTTDKSSYDHGEPVVMTFTETNNGNQPVTVLEGPTVFDVTWNGEDFFAYSDYQFLHTGSPPTWQTLLPGQSYSQTYTWQSAGQSTTTESGTFVLSNLLDATGTTATIQVSPFWPPPAAPVAPPTPTPPPTYISPPPAKPVSPPPVVSAPNPAPSQPVVPAPASPTPAPTPTSDLVSTSRSVYKLGQAVHISVTMNNVASDTTSSKLRASVGRVTIWDGSTAVWRSKLSNHMQKRRGTGSGKAITLTSLWNGRPNQPDVERIKPGSYTVMFDEAGHETSTTIRIV
jgi:hypothetical protein